MNSFDPMQTLGPDDPLRAWMDDPAAAEFVKQKALEHASNVLGFSDPYGNNIDSVSGMPTRPDGTPVSAGQTREPNPNPVPAGQVPLPTPYPTEAPTGPSYVMDKGPATSIPAKVNEGIAASPLDPAEVQLPVSRSSTNAPAGASDVSAKKKGDFGDAANDFSKTLAGLKPLQPPPVNAVGTPAAPHPGAISAPQIQQILQLLGAQSRPDPAATLGRLLVSGKA